MDEGQKKCACIGLIVVGICVSVFALIFSSYSDLHYYEIGFAKSQTTGSVDTSNVYTSGRYWLGPTKEFKTFEAASHEIWLSEITVFTSVDKLEIYLSVFINYFLVADDLALLHDEYDVNYAELMESSAQAAVKNSANKFMLTQFYAEREEVEKAIHATVQERLGGLCCPENCTVSLCLPNCIERTSCTTADKGLFVDTRYLQLTSISIPLEVETRNLAALVLTEQTAKESYIQQSSIITKETERLVDEIENQALEVEADAQANSDLIAAKSEAKYQKILEEARMEGLQVLFQSLNFTQSGQKNSFDYLRALKDHSNAHLTVDFDQLIIASKSMSP